MKFGFVAKHRGAWPVLMLCEFKPLKTERTDRKVYRTRADAKADVFDNIEVFYNGRRRHSTIGYVSPIQFEQQMELA